MIGNCANCGMIGYLTYRDGLHLCDNCDDLYVEEKVNELNHPELMSFESADDFIDDIDESLLKYPKKKKEKKKKDL